RIGRFQVNVIYVKWHFYSHTVIGAAIYRRKIAR
ncbi:uncharacterized protein METZ01_LOCUS303278, partial [marine metagenome]